MFSFHVHVFIDTIIAEPALMMASAIDGFDAVAGMLAQIGGDAAGAAADGAAVDGAAGGEDPGFVQRLLANPLLLPISLFVIFYLTFIAPERRKKADEAKMMASLSKNDRVITIGGIHATVVSVGGDDGVVTLKIDEGGGTRIKVNRSAIASITESANKPKTDGKSAATTEKA
ncbi:preprotein translocase subunit YajC [Crateriforma conspicua]|nr:preprotein translocase subunit YajC [Crateriforma conspicua]